MKDKEYYEQKEEAEQIKADMDFEIIKDEKMKDKATAIVDNLNNERVATIYKKEQTLSDWLVALMCFFAILLGVNVIWNLI